MTRSDGERIADMLDAAGELHEIVGRGRASFDDDVAVRRAAERLLEIIGEAATGISDEMKADLLDVPWRDISRLRIVIAHHYHRVDPDQVWTIAVTEVPTLVEVLRSRGF